MITINENYLKLQDSYLFSTIAKKVAKFTKEQPDKKVIKLGIGDVTLPIAPAVGEAIKKATDEMLQKETFRGYGPEQGYDFLREKIATYDYETLGVPKGKVDMIYLCFPNNPTRNRAYQTRTCQLGNLCKRKQSHYSI